MHGFVRNGCNRQDNGKNSVYAFPAAYTDTTSMLAHNSVRFTEAQASALSFSLGCKEWVEDGTYYVLWDAFPCIYYLNRHSLMFLPKR